MRIIVIQWYRNKERMKYCILWIPCFVYGVQPIYFIVVVLSYSEEKRNVYAEKY